jgi:hypothetical protein
MSNTEQKATPGMGIVGPCRFSYLTVFKPRQNPNKEGIVNEYSVTLMIPKVANEFCPDPTSVGKKIRALIQEALDLKFPQTPAKWTNPLQDGDVETNDEGKPKHPGYWFVRVWAGEEYPPLLIDCDREKVTGGWGSGDWGLVKASFYGYDQKGNKGVSGGLRAVQFLKKDEALGSQGTSPDEFEQVAGDKVEAGTDPFAD